MARGYAGGGVYIQVNGPSHNFPILPTIVFRYAISGDAFTSGSGTALSYFDMSAYGRQNDASVYYTSNMDGTSTTTLTGNVTPTAAGYNFAFPFSSYQDFVSTTGTLAVAKTHVDFSREYCIMCGTAYERG